VASSLQQGGGAGASQPWRRLSILLGTLPDGSASLVLGISLIKCSRFSTVSNFGQEAVAARWNSMIQTLPSLPPGTKKRARRAADSSHQTLPGRISAYFMSSDRRSTSSAQEGRSCGNSYRSSGFGNQFTPRHWSLCTPASVHKRLRVCLSGRIDDPPPFIAACALVNEEHLAHNILSWGVAGVTLPRTFPVKFGQRGWTLAWLYLQLFRMHYRIL